VALTPADLRATLRRLHLRQVEAAPLLGVSRSALTGWLTEPGADRHRPIPAWLPRMLAALEAHPEAIETLRGLAQR
jgi:hypothetical protein